MKIYFYEILRQKIHYTSKLLKFLIHRQNNLEIVDKLRDADCVFVSVCDITELHLIREARVFCKPIISGGALSQFPVMRVWSDYVCVGEVYDFIEKLNKVKRIQEIESFPEIATKVKPGILNENIRFELNPVINFGSKAAYLYCGKGCPQRCKYCLMGNSRKWQFMEEIRFIAALRAIGNRKLYPMLSFFPYKNIPNELQQNLGILDVRIKDFLRNSSAGKNIRTGVEFFSEEKRKLYGKPMLDQEINLFLKKVQFLNKTTVLYFIAGLEDVEAETFIEEVLPESNKITPRIICILTYIDPQPLTPMQNMDIREKITFDGELFFKKAVRKNRGIRVHRMKKISFSSWRTVMQRSSNLQELEFCFRLRKERNNNRLLELVDNKFPHLLGVEKF